MQVGQKLSRKEVQFTLKMAIAGKLKYEDKIWINNTVKSLAIDLLNRMNALDELNKELDIVKKPKSKSKKTTIDNKK